jgi:hypothetical protein
LLDRLLNRSCIVRYETRGGDRVRLGGEGGAEDGESAIRGRVNGDGVGDDEEGDGDYGSALELAENGCETRDKLTRHVG